MKAALVLTGAVSALMLALPALAADNPAGGRCFYTRDLRNHTVGDPHTLYFDVGGRNVYRVGMSNACLAGASSSDPIVLKQRGGGTTICKPIDLDISVSLGGIPSHCIVTSLTPLSPAEIAALPKGVRP